MENSKEILCVVRDIVQEALRVNLCHDASKLTKELLEVFGWHSVLVTSPIDVPKDLEQFTENYELKQVQKCPTVSAPFPESAGSQSGEYDPIEAAKLLPAFNDLPFQFCAEHSAIKTDNQTVVMNSAHYSDLLAIRDIAAALKELISYGVQVIINHELLESISVHGQTKVYLNEVSLLEALRESINVCIPAEPQP